MISTESTTKTELFTLKRKEIAFFLPDSSRTEYHVLPWPVGSKRLRLAIAFGTSDAHLREVEILAYQTLASGEKKVPKTYNYVSWVILVSMCAV